MQYSEAELHRNSNNARDDPLWRFLIFCSGRPLATSEEGAEHVGPASGVPIFGLDALSSAAYGPEAALTLLIPLGLAGVHYIVPITAAILALLIIVFFSYCQTIDAYPHGGGSYTVASENLGPHAGLLAASALMIDYVLTAAVGISAGVGALVSAVPSLQPHILGLCLLILIILSIVNMRGVREAGVFFTAPTYLFIGTLLILIVVGLFKAVIHGGHPSPIVAPPALPKAATALSFWLLLKVFSSGCTAMTGVEAVSNGTPAFRDPNTKNGEDHADHHHRDADHAPRRYRLVMPCLRRGRHRPERRELPKRAVDAPRGRAGPRLVLLPHHRCHPVGAIALGQHRLRGLPTPHARHCPRRLLAACIHRARADVSFTPTACTR